MLSSSRRTFIFSLPSSETQSPRSCSCTFRVGLDVIGTSYLQAVKARMHRQTARPKPDRTEIKFDEATARVLERAQSFSNYLGSFDARSEERRVGKECRSQWSTYDYKKKETK